MNAVKNSLPTMSSLELVAIINELRPDGSAELMHKNLLAKIESHPGIQSAEYLADYKDSKGRTYKCYHLPKRECELLVMAESLEVQTRVYDRLTELEHRSLDMPLPVSQQSHDLVMVPGAMAAAFAFGFAGNDALICANRYIATHTGVDVLSCMGKSVLPSPAQDIFYTPTELGKIHFQGASGMKVNQLLARAGLQVKRGEHWAPTDEASTLCRVMDTSKRHGNGTPVQQVKWSDLVVHKLVTAAAKAA